MNRVAGVVTRVATLTVFAFASIAGLAEPDYRDLKNISSFGSILATVHVAGPEDTAKPGLSSAQLTQRAEERFVGAFPGIPYRKIAPADWGTPENLAAMGRLSCRAWINADLATAEYQIKCQISTGAHANIIEDGSLGYAPKDKVADIVNQQIDRIVTGFGAAFQAAKMAP